MMTGDTSSGTSQTTPTMRPVMSLVAKTVLATRGYLAHLLAFSLAINLLILAVPLFMIQIFDRVLVSHSLETLVVLVIGAVVALSVMAALDMIRGRILARAAIAMEQALGETLFRHKREIRIGDAARLRQFMTGQLMVTLLDAPWIPMFLVVIFMLDPLLGWIALLGAAILAAMGFATERWTQVPRQSSRAAERAAETMIRSVALDDGTAALHGLHRRMGERWRRMSQAAAGHRLDLADRCHTASVAARFVRLALQVALMGAAAALVIGSHITPGAMVAASVIAARALGPIERAQEAWHAVLEVRACLTRLMRTGIVAERNSSGFPEPATPELVVENLSVTPVGHRQTLFKDVSFRLRGGEMLGITGPTGTGKSVLARVLAGLTLPDTGRVTLDQRDMSDVTLDQARDDIAYLSQSPALAPGTIADNIARFDHAALAAVQAAAKRAGADDAILDLPFGYDTEIGAGQPPLPRGLTQRVLLARTFFAEPRLIVMDEPYTFLDNAGIEHLIGALSDLRRQGSAVVIVSQRPSVLAQCDRVLVLDAGHGRLVGRRRKTDLRVLENGDAVAGHPNASGAQDTLKAAAE